MRWRPPPGTRRARSVRLRSGADHYVEPADTPDGRVGAVVQFHVPRFRKDRVEALERALLTRICQNVLTCATTRCFNTLDTEPCYKLGRKVAFLATATSFAIVALAGAFGSCPFWVANSSWIAGLVMLMV